MNKILIAAAVCAVLFICIAAVPMIKKSKFKKMSGFSSFLCALGLIVTGAGTALCIFASNYYHAKPTAEKYLESSGDVKVKRLSDYCFFDGSGNDDAVIFYPGAKVEYTAYAPLMYRLAESGIDCYVMEMPLNIAFFGINKADKIIDIGSYKRYFLAGHSLGGVAASGYCAKNPDKAEGIIFLASFPALELGDDADVLSLYGSRDGVLDMEKYEHGKEYFPEGAEEHCIEGGNHAGFADYGAQKGDNAADISNEEQIDITAAYITDFISRSESVS